MKAQDASPLRASMALLLLLACTPEAGRSPEAPASADPLSEALSARVQVDLRAWRPDGERLVAHHPALDLKGELSRDGARLTTAESQVDVRLVAWGREGAGQAVDADPPTLGACAEGVELDTSGDCARRAELRSEGLTEWWVSREAGLQQGWEVDAAPAGEGPLALSLQITGAEVTLDEDGSAAWLSTPAGDLLRMTEIFAWDATGEPLDAWLEQDGAGLALLVDDTDAVWPITVDPLYSTASASLTGPATNSYFGWSVDSAGDVNNDGYDDVIVGAYNYSTGAGVAYVYHGSSGGLSTTAATTLSGSSSSAFGYSVSGVGDVNNDGYDDVAVGSPAYSSNAGRAYVFHGSSSGVSTTASTTISGAPSTYTGACVTAVGDINRDGYADIAVGAPWNGGYNGSVLVYHGSASGTSSTVTTTINGPGPNSYFGWSIAGGDVTGDGYADLLIGAYYRSSYTGAAYLYRSSGTSLSTTATTSLTGSSSSYFGWAVQLADVTGDGYDDAIIGSYNYSSATGLVSWYKGSSSGLASSASGTLSGSSSSRFGFSLGHEDINADGYDDVLVGSPYYSSYYGRVSLYQGSSSGPSSATTSITASTSGSYLGYAVAGAGDVNGDGYGDVVAGGPYQSTNTGAAYVYNGYADNDSDGYASSTDCDDSDSSIGDSITFYLDSDGDGFGVETSTAGACTAPDGYAALRDEGFDCDDSRFLTNPNAEEVADDGIDADCDSEELCYLDTDSDGFRGDTTSTVVSEDLDCADDGEASADVPAGDCDDDDDTINPGIDETPGDEIDQDCDGQELCYFDEDTDGYRASDDTVLSDDVDCDDEGEADDNALSGDCDDSDPDTSPGQGEVPDDGVDQDCSGGDTCYADADNDGVRETAGPVIDSDDLDCEDTGEAGLDVITGDCDDDNGAVYPGSSEVCDGLDNDCDGLTDTIIPTEGPGAWYEIDVCEDSDDDGLLDYTERTVTLTDPNDDDSDDDGVEDGTEYGLSEAENPDVTSSEFDPDQDPSTTTDPLDPDSDDDDLLDGQEDQDADGSVDERETDPNNPDSDGGGAPDGEELEDGTDPLDPTDDPGYTGEGEGEGEGEGGGEETGGGGTDKGCDCATANAPSRSGMLLAGLAAFLAFVRRDRKS